MYDNFEIINIVRFDTELGVNMHEYNAILIGGMLLE